MLEVRRPGRLSYARGLELQQELRDARLAGAVPDVLLLLEHSDVITFGRGSRRRAALLSDEDLRAAGYDVHHIDRGGDVTWHGPGQLVGYPILDLARRGRDIPAYLRDLEGVLIDCLRDFDIEARQRHGYTGVWIDERRKIASIGVGIRRWVTAHGFALNVCCDLSRFDPIIPCGLEGVEMTRMVDLTSREFAFQDVMDRAEARFREAFS